MHNALVTITLLISLIGCADNTEVTIDDFCIELSASICEAYTDCYGGEWIKCYSEVYNGLGCQDKHDPYFRCESGTEVSTTTVNDCLNTLDSLTCEEFGVNYLPEQCELSVVCQ